MKKSATPAIAQPLIPRPPFDEDLPVLAGKMYELAQSHCGKCRNFHSLWPYLRIARMVGAAESGAAKIEETLAALIASGAKRILIAAAADTGLLATIARAARGYPIEITIVDQCQTPLELCRCFAARWSLRVDTQIADLTTLDVRGFDLIYANSVLQFIPSPRRIETLARMRLALRPGGYLACVFNTGGRLSGDVLPEYRSSYADWLLAEIDRRGIPLPDARETFHQRADEYSRERETREGAFRSPEVIDNMMEAAGFVIRSRDRIDMPLASSYQNVVSRISKKRFLTLAQSPTS